ncbi:hypothetical protein IMG5_067760, partial [Ichthyophthirius multifiliis]
TSINIMEDEYFGEDNQKKENDRNKFINPETINRLRDHQVTFNLGIFLEFFWYHILFYVFLGPLVNLIYLKRLNLMGNLGFFGNSFDFYFQTFFYINNMVNISLYFLTTNQNVYFLEILFTIFIIILRCYIIAAKYATLHEDKIQLYKNYYIERQYRILDFYLKNWAQQNYQTIYRETYNSIQRGEIDQALFYISFFVDPNNQIQTEIEQMNNELSKQHKYTSSKFQSNSYNQVQNGKMFYGYGIIGYIIQQYKKTQIYSKSIPYLCIILALVRSSIPIAFRYLYQKNINLCNYEVIQLAMLFFNTFLGYSISFVFLFNFIRDLKLKLFCQLQCQLMLQVKKEHKAEKKCLPTIDITNPYSLKSWSILRRILLDYGKSYFLRLQSYLSFYLFYILFNLILVFLWVTNLYQLNLIYPFICFYELTVTFSILLYMLFLGALINEKFEKFDIILGDHQIIFKDILRMEEIYSDNENQGKISNFVFKKSIFKIKQYVNDNNILFKEHLNSLLDGIESCKLELQQDSINQPLTFFGIKITLPLFQSIVAGLTTAFVALAQVYLQIHQQKNSPL